MIRLGVTGSETPGRVGAVEVLEDSTGLAGLAECMAKKVASWRFAAGLTETTTFIKEVTVGQDRVQLVRARLAEDRPIP